MYLDCLVDEKFVPVFNDDPVAVFEYIKKNQPFPSDYQVYVGFSNKMVTIEDYLENFEKLH